MNSEWEYAPAPETTEVNIESRYGLFVGGRFIASKGRRRFDTINPATEISLSSISESNEKDIDAAVASARKAFRGWSRTKPIERAKYLYRIARRIQERARELAILESMDGGKPIRESRDVDIPLVAQHFFHHAGWCDKLQYAIPGHHDPRPLGVCAQVIPWNFPLLMAAWKIAPALACGNTVVLKPAETTSLTALRLAEIFQECELPEGVVNIVTGAGETGRLLVEHRGVNKVAFTGSTEVGKMIARSCAGTSKRVTLELGGKSPNIVFADAAIDQAVEGVVSAIWFNQGHVCCAGSRLFLEESIHDEFVRRLEHRMRKLRVGDPLDKNTDVGAINSGEQLEKINSYLQHGVDEGATMTQCCERDLPENGFWCRPTFFTEVQPSAKIAREEIFGPVLSVMTFRTPEEAIQRANDSPYGLSAGIWTDKGSKVFEIASRMKAGVIWCNTFNKFDAASPFGGYKESGWGREGGRHGLAAYLA
ncbi:MAG: betaine-aldehyde dehydrogenase [Planctomycetes bacterium TMED75]|nr:betaine-aldehyde dehydrogenase [Planctomycetaceae bacterium]OUU91154.1 MAG: betaine-aldehyde dehydrogenase [Planctomycetes bacterium TMED75]